MIKKKLLIYPGHMFDSGKIIIIHLVCTGKLIHLIISMDFGNTI